MKKQVIIYHADGENQGTYGALCFAENFTGDLKQLTKKFVSHDFDQSIDVPMYKQRTEILPEWMNEADYLRHEVALKFSVALAGKCVLSLSKDAFIRFSDLSDRLKFWYGWAQNQKSPFIVSLLGQFNAWLNGENEYKTPLTPSQFEAGAKFCPLYKAKQISEKLYWSINKFYV
jgi:hypothetical protein